MDQNLINLLIALLALLVSFYCFYLIADLRKKSASKTGSEQFSTRPLQLQAYERLSVFAERSSLKNLVARTPFGHLNVVDFQLALMDTLRSEYEYNISQQIYLSPDMWRAINNLKDQNIYIINQIAATLHPNAPAIELSRRLLEYASNPNAELSHIVLDALQYEAKKIL